MQRMADVPYRDGYMLGFSGLLVQYKEARWRRYEYICISFVCSFFDFLNVVHLVMSDKHGDEHGDEHGHEPHVDQCMDWSDDFKQDSDLTTQLLASQNWFRFNVHESQQVFFLSVKLDAPATLVICIKLRDRIVHLCHACNTRTPKSCALQQPSNRQACPIMESKHYKHSQDYEHIVTAEELTQLMETDPNMRAKHTGELITKDDSSRRSALFHSFIFQFKHPKYTQNIRTFLI
jgi:hypothetical protein